jgi:hypothetical protein
MIAANSCTPHAQQFRAAVDLMTTSSSPGDA